MFTLQFSSHRSHVFYELDTPKGPEIDTPPKNLHPRTSYRPSPLPEGIQNAEKTENFFKNLNAKDSAGNYMVSDDKVKAFKTDMLAKFPTLGSNIGDLKLDNFAMDNFGSNRFGEQLKIRNDQTGITITVNVRGEVVEKGNFIFEGLKSQIDVKDYDKIKELMKGGYTLEGNANNGSLELKNAQGIVKDGVRIKDTSAVDINAGFKIMANSHE